MLVLSAVIRFVIVCTPVHYVSIDWVIFRESFVFIVLFCICILPSGMSPIS